MPSYGPRSGRDLKYEYNRCCRVGTVLVYAVSVSVSNAVL